MPRPLAFTLLALAATLLAIVVVTLALCAAPDGPATGDRGPRASAVELHGAAVARWPADVLALKTLGIAHHELATANVAGVASVAARTLERVHRLVPADPEVLAYLGSARTLVGRETWHPLTKLVELREGTALMDRAVELAPDDAVVRLVRASSRLRLPAFLQRDGDACADLERIVARAAPALGSVRMAEVHFKLGQAYRARNDGERARAEWAKAVEAAPGSPWGRAARRRLGT